MPIYRLDSIASLARQMGFAPRAKRLEQLAAAEELLLRVEPERAYPLSFVVHAVTDFRGKDADATNAELLTGVALQHDLGILVESVSDAMELPALEVPEPVLTIEAVCDRFGVTSKTIQRWRRRGLPARRLAFDDGRKRVAFRLSCVERFIANGEGSAQRPAGVAPLDAAAQSACIAAARRLALAGHCRNETVRRVARRLGRSSLAILHTLEHHDRLNAHAAVLPMAREPLSAAAAESAAQAVAGGASLRVVSDRLGCRRSGVYRALVESRAERLAATGVRYHNDALFHADDPADAEGQVDQLVSNAERGLAERDSAECRRVPRNLPAYLASLYRTPLLTPGLERALFLHFNFHKCRFAALRSRLDPHLCRRRDLDRLERHARLARSTKNRIISANLRLVVSVARRHLRPDLDLMELVSEGNLVLMRAVEGFDVARGFRFSTYATLALMKGYARTVPQLQSARGRGGDSGAMLTASQLDRNLADVVARDQLQVLLGHLGEQEREVMSAGFGLGRRRELNVEELSQCLGISPGRVRQLERSALLKLRRAARVVNN